MAPNRKQLALALDLEVLSTEPLVQAKYMPLTSAAQTAPITPPAAPVVTTIRSNVNSDDYWYENNGPEPNLFSASHLEANLQKDAGQCSTAPVIRASTCDNDYWAERIEAHMIHSESNAACSQAMSYWEWPVDASSVQIALILKEEMTRKEFSVDAVEANLIKDAAVVRSASQIKPAHDDYWAEASVVHAAPAAVNETYWEWNTEASAPQVKKQMIATIVAYEQVRSLFSAAHFESNLVADAAKVCESSPAAEANDAYWCWPAEEDDYWTERPMSLVERAEAIPVQGYWNM